MFRLIAALALLACSPGEDRERPGETATVAPPAGSAPPGNGACPATGSWTECAILERLERSGLAPQLDSAGATEKPLTQPGLLVRVGNSELELYIFSDERTRERAEATLDMRRYVAYDAAQSLLAEPTLIRSANLLAILHSRSTKQRERVSDAITAGPPQPSTP